LVKLRNGRIAGLGQRTFPILDAGFDSARRGIPAHIAFECIRPNGCADTGTARLVRIDELPSFGLPSPAIRFLLMIKHSDAINEDALKSFCGLFKLSRAEQCVLRELMGDATPEEIAQRQGTSLNTIRTHLKNIRRKTGVHRMTELVRMALAATRAL
jgi:DNA-binding CsgD family transcriptional regulator